MKLGLQNYLRKLPGPSADTPGLVKTQPAQADLAAAATLADTIAAHNALLAKLRTAGIIA